MSLPTSSVWVLDFVEEDFTTQVQVIQGVCLLKPETV